MKISIALCTLACVLCLACGGSSAQGTGSDERQTDNGEAERDAERHAQFMELWEMEVQNRAWGLESAERILEREPTGDDLLFLSNWKRWEDYLKEKYAPYASKYGLSQEPGRSERRRAGLSVIGNALLSERRMSELMLDSTIDYLEKLRPIVEVAPEEDAAFFAFVVRQEEVQVDSLRHRLEGENQQAVDVLIEFMNAHP